MSMKQVILVRRDLHMRRAEIAALVSRASSEFLFENDESERSDEVSVKLTPQEAEWIQSGSTRIVLGVPSGESMQSHLFKAEMAGLSCYTVVGSLVRTPDDPVGMSSIVCAAIGPDESSKIDEITGKLKLL